MVENAAMAVAADFVFMSEAFAPARGWTLKPNDSKTLEPGRAGQQVTVTVIGPGSCEHILVDADNVPLPGAAWSRLNASAPAVTIPAGTRRMFRGEGTSDCPLAFVVT
jgi:hypothetical protein